MRFAVIAVLCACAVLAAGDGLRTKAKLLGKLAAKIKHHKRGVFSAAPPYKYGHDIPHVTHSIVKPIVVAYPPTASVHSVKVPIKHPLLHHHYPVHVGHKIPLHSHSYAHRFPHTKLKPDQHFHHHHHHVAPRPIVPILPAHAVPATPVVPTLPIPIPQPSVVIPRPIPAPSPPVAPIIPATPQFILPQNHVHLRPALPAPVPIQPAPVAPLYPYAPQFSYAIRPGNAVQTSYFATYPRYPLSFHQHFVPLAQPALPAVPLAPSVAPAAGPVFLEHPQEPHFHVLPQAHAHGVVEQPTSAVAVEHHHQFLQPTAVPQPTLLHAHPTVVQEQPVVHEHPTILQPHPTVLQAAQPTVHVDHNGWAPVPHGHDLNHVHQEAHFHQDLVPTQETHFAHDHFTQEQGQQVFEHHTGEEQYHEYQHQLQHHIQQQIEQAQYEQNLHNHQLGQPEYPQNHDFSQGQDFAQHGHDFSQHGHDFSQHGHDFSQHGHDFSQHGHDFSQHGHDFSQGQDFSQHGQDFSHTQDQPHQEYGVPQQLEGRSEEGEEPQKFHNHIPLGLQPPIDRPLDHFR